MKQPFEAVWGSVCGSSIEGREGGGKQLTVLLILMLLSDNAWSSVWGIVEGREGGGKHLTPQNWTLGRGQTGGMFGVGKLLLNCCLHCTYSMRHYGRIYQITKLVQVHHFKTITFLLRKVLHFLTVKQGIIPRM